MAVTGFSLRRCGAVLVAGLTAWAMLLTPAAGAAEQDPPDQVDPPAEGEGQPLEDPSDPAPPRTTSAQPTVRLGLDGPTWRRPRIAEVAGGNRFQTAAAASRRGWPSGARAAVLVNGGKWQDALSASALAGAVGGPLLLTERGTLTGSTAKELARLRPRRVYLIGALSARTARRVRNLGATTERVGSGWTYRTSFEVARRAAEILRARGRQPSRVIVASGQRPGSSYVVGALAAGKRYPVLLTRRAADRARLQRWVRALRVRRTIVIGPTSHVSRWVVAKLPRRERLQGPSPAANAAAVASRARSLGLNGRPLLVAGPGTAATAGGVYAGAARHAAAIIAGGRELPAPSARWLARHRPRRVTLLGGGAIKAMTRCQVRRGGWRRWGCAERALQRQGYVVPNTDGRLDRFSIWAVYAFEKVARRTPDGYFGEREWRRMLDAPRMRVRRPDLPSTHIEVNIARQLLLLIKGGRVAHVIHTSTGKPSTPTIRGTFTVYEKRDYYQPWNGIYRGIFFHGGYAIHGYAHVPTYPASHGCVRVYNGNQDFLWPKVFVGERIATY